MKAIPILLQPLWILRQIYGKEQAKVVGANTFSFPRIVYSGIKFRALHRTTTPKPVEYQTKRIYLLLFLPRHESDLNKL